MSAGDIPIGDFSYPAGVSFAAKQFYAVYIDSSGYAQLATASYPMMGIIQDNPVQYKIAAIRELGHSKAVVGLDAGAVAKGSPLRVSTSVAGALELGVIGTDVIVAVALEAVPVTLDIIEVALTARTAQGVSARAGHLVFQIPIKSLYTTSSTYVYEAMPLGFVGAVVDMFAVANSTCGATTSATALLKVFLGAAGHTELTGLTIPVTQLTKAKVEAIGTVMTSTGTAAVNTFVATDKISIQVTKGSTSFGSSDTGTIELHVVTN